MNFFEFSQKDYLKISFALKMKTSYLIEWSNGEAYQSIVENGGLLQFLFQDTYKSAFATMFSEGYFTPCNQLHTAPFKFPVLHVTSSVLACYWRKSWNVIINCKIMYFVVSLSFCSQVLEYSFPYSNTFSLLWLFRKITFQVVNDPHFGDTFMSTVWYSVMSSYMAKLNSSCNVSVLPLIPLPRLLSRFYIRFNTVSIVFFG